MSFQAVARDAGVSRATLYRHWPHPDELIFEALAEIVSEWQFSGPGRLREQLISVIDRRRRELNQPLVRIADSLRESIEAGVARGELEPGLDADLLAAEVMGAMVWQSFVLGRNVSRGFVEQVVGEALARWEKNPPRS